jgi:epoxyqueuosine reductase
MLMNPSQGSFFFIGVIYSNLDLSNITDSPTQLSECGKCQACIKLCPTGAITNDKTIDSRKCISYLTIENKGAIPVELRPKMGNRIYGCDDCQMVCHFNNDAPMTLEDDFKSRDVLVNRTLLELFNWSEEDFLKHTEGSAIRRIGYISWIRNLSVGIGNSPYDKHNITALNDKKLEFLDNELILEHIDWALSQQHNII